MKLTKRIKNFLHLVRRQVKSFKAARYNRNIDRMYCARAMAEEGVAPAIYRDAEVDYRLSHDKHNGFFLFFGATLKLDKDDVDFDFFKEENLQVGLTTAKLCGNGKLTFANDYETFTDDYIKTMGPQKHGRFPFRHFPMIKDTTVIWSPKQNHFADLW